MVLEMIEYLCRCLSQLWRGMLSSVGIKSMEDTAVSSNAYYDYRQPMGINRRDFIQPMYQHDFSRSAVTNRTAAANRLSLDADRFTNQSSVSSSVMTLPRPFHAAVRQNALSSGTSLSTASHSLIHRNTSQSALAHAYSGTHRSGGCSPGPSSSSWVEIPVTEGEPSHQQVTEPEPVSAFDDRCDPHLSENTQPFHAAVVNLVGGSRAGLKGSRPLVKLNRLTMLARGTAPDSSSVYSSAPSSFVAAPHPRSQSNDATPPVINKIKNLSASFATLLLKDLSLLHVIGGGGFGQVWRGTWGGTPVAVKLLTYVTRSPDRDDLGLLAAFEEEVFMLAQLRHPNICLFLGVCLESPQRAIVTELVPRGSLWDALRECQLFQKNSRDLPWPPTVLRRVLEGTCRGLIYLHAHSPPIIHRDLKSANILLDEAFNVKICDFGLARLRDYNTVLTANVGTIHWMAPEVLTGTQYDESADIYSVGIVLWELFTGLCPYEGMKQVEVALSVVQNNMRPVLPSSCSPPQADLIRRCWSSVPQERYSAMDLLQHIDHTFPLP